MKKAKAKPKKRWRLRPDTGRMVRIPTYNPDPGDGESDFAKPRIPIYFDPTIDGIWLGLGAKKRACCKYKPGETEWPNIVVERRKNGWAIFLHPVGGGDTSGAVYFLDDGRSFITRGCYPDSCESNIKMVDWGDPKKEEVDQTPKT